MLWWCSEFSPQAWIYRFTSVSQMFHLSFEERKSPICNAYILTVLHLQQALPKRKPRDRVSFITSSSVLSEAGMPKSGAWDARWEFCKMFLGKENRMRKSGKEGDEQSYSLSWGTASLWSHRELELQTTLLCQPFLGARKSSFVLPSSQPPVGNVVYVKWNSFPKRRSLWGFSD